MIFDLLVVFVILGAIALGAWKGFAWQLAAIGSLLAGWVVAIPLSQPLAPLFGKTAPLNRFIALAVLYVVVSLGIYIVAMVYKRVLERWQLHHWDHHLGGVLGAVKGFLLCLALTFFAVTLSKRLREGAMSTKSGRLMGRFMMAVHPVWPREVHATLEPYIHHLDAPEHPH